MPAFFHGHEQRGIGQQQAREEEREMKVIGTIGRLSEVILGEESGEYYAIVPLRNRKGETFNEAWKRIKKKFAPRKKKAEAPRG